MRRVQRLIAATVLLALGSALGACTQGIGSWDPTDLLDFLDTKKKLQGNRQPVFPDGVPGLEQGVPKELYKGEAERQQQQDASQAAATAAAQPAPKPKQAKLAKGKPPADSAPAAEGEAQQADGAAAAAPPPPKARKLVHTRTTPPADQSAAQPNEPAEPAPVSQSAPPAQAAQQSPPPFPAPLPSGSFTR